MSHYETNDEYDVARGIVDALSQKPIDNQTGADWLGWKITDGSLGAIDIETPEGKRYRVIVEPIED